MKQILKTYLAIGLIALGMGAALQAQASVIIAGTRIIYNAKEREITVKLTNNGQTPALTQIWIDKGDPSATPASIVDVPFTVTPPVARLDVGKAQTLRLIYTGEPMPKDKESVFYFNVLEVPPKPTGEAAEGNLLQMAIRTRIKLFFRPAGLDNAADSPTEVAWRLVQVDNKPALEGHNASKFHVNLASVELLGDGKPGQTADGGMIEPGGTKVFPLTGTPAPGAKTTVRYDYINDFGGNNKGEAPLSADSPAEPPGKK